MNRFGTKYFTCQRRFWRSFYWQHRYAFRRAWNGYDDTDIFNFDSNLRERLLVTLKEFKECNFALFTNPDGHEVLTEEETDKVIDEMINLLEIATRDSFEGTNTSEETLAKDKESTEAFSKFLDMFKKWGTQVNY